MRSPDANAPRTLPHPSNASQNFTPPDDETTQIVVQGGLHLEYLLQIDAAATDSPATILREIRTLGGAAVLASTLAQWQLQVLARVSVAGESDGNARFARRALEIPNLKLENSAEQNSFLAEQPYRVQIFAPDAAPQQMQRGPICAELSNDVNIWAHKNDIWQPFAGAFEMFETETSLQVLAAASTPETHEIWDVNLNWVSAAALVMAWHRNFSRERAQLAARTARNLTRKQRMDGADFLSVPHWNAIENAMSETGV